MIIKVPEVIERVWILSFELEGFARLGGLGVAVGRYVRTLTREGLEVTVFTPSHGRHFDEGVRMKLNLRPIEWFKVRGSRVGIDGRVYSYYLGAEEGWVNGVRLIIFKGLDYDTGRFLDQWYIYSEIPEKVCLYTRALKHWVELTDEVPDLIHSNDWTSGLAGVMLKVYFERMGYFIPHVHSVHLISSPSFPWHYASSDWCGVEDVEHRFWVGYKHELRSIRSVWDLVNGNVDHFVVLEADVVTTASFGYLNEVLERFGRWLEPKTYIIRNVTDWDINLVRDLAIRRLGTDSRRELRTYIINYLNKELKISKYGYLNNVKLLITSSGRLTWQKGFDMLIKALTHVSKEVGLLITGLKVGDTLFESTIMSLSDGFPGRVLIVFDPLPDDLLKLIIYSSNVFVVPSRYEPFGIASIEAQALGTPVVVSSVGGLPETVLDLRTNVNGSGVIVNPWDEWELGKVSESLAYLTEIIDSGSKDLTWKIVIDWIRDLAIRYDVNVRENAVKWVNSNFREHILKEALIKCYDKARLYAYYRSIS